MATFSEDLASAVSYHGHLCSGQIIGVRMARMALQLLAISDPKVSKSLVAYVECDRCLTDAISSVTGCKLGKRTLKWTDYGKSAATFINLNTGESLRLYRKFKDFPPKDIDLLAYYDSIPDTELFSVQKVRVSYRAEDLPGKPLDAMICPQCGEEVIDGRQVSNKKGELICKACAFGSYYTIL